MVISNLLLGMCVAISVMNSASHTFLTQEIQGFTLDLEDEKSLGQGEILPESTMHSSGVCVHYILFLGILFC